jgi:hypothetical protein
MYGHKLLMSFQTGAKFVETHSTTSVTVSVRHQLIINIEQITPIMKVFQPHGKSAIRQQAQFMWAEQPAV